MDGKTVKRVLDATPEYVHAEIGAHDYLIIKWGVPGTGWGEFYCKTDQTGKLIIDNECMSKDFIKKIFNRMIDEAILTDG